MVIDPLKQYTVEEIAALSPTVQDFIALAKYEKNNRASHTEDQSITCKNNIVRMFKAIGKEEVIAFVDTQLAPRPMPQHPFKMQHELDKISKSD